MKLMWMRHDQSKCQSSNIWGVLNESGTDYGQCQRKVASRRKVADDIRSPVNVKGLQLERARVLYEGLLAPVLIYGSETMIWIEKVRFKIRDVQMDNLKRERLKSSEIVQG